MFGEQTFAQLRTSLRFLLCMSDCCCLRLLLHISDCCCLRFLFCCLRFLLSDCCCLRFLFCCLRFLLRMSNCCCLSFLLHISCCCCLRFLHTYFCTGLDLKSLLRYCFSLYKNNCNKTSLKREKKKTTLSETYLVWIFSHLMCHITSENNVLQH